jgi:hypothetical protein
MAFERVLTLGLVVDMRDRASFTAARIGRALGGLERGARDTSIAVNQLVAGLAVGFVGGKMLGGVKKMTSESAKFETVMTNVARIMGTGAANFDTLNDEFLKASNTIPASARDLGLVAQQIARLGLTANLSEKAVAELSKTTVMFATATGISSEKAAMDLGRLLNLFPQLRAEFAKNPRVIDGVASSLLKMDVTSGGTAESIARMTQRFGGLFEGMGGTIDQAFAISAALQNSLDPAKVEPAGTAIMQVFQRLSKRMGDFSDVMGLSEETLRRFTTGADDPATFIRLFARRLRELRDTGADMPQVFAKLGLELARTQPVLFAMANQVEAIDTQLGLANEAFENGTELMRQYEEVMIPLEARVARLNSTFASLLTILGEFGRQVEKSIVITLQGVLDLLFLIPTPILVVSGAVLSLGAVLVFGVGVMIAFSAVLLLVGLRLNSLLGHFSPLTKAFGVFLAHLKVSGSFLASYAAGIGIFSRQVKQAGLNTGVMAATLARLNKTAAISATAAKSGGVAWLFWAGAMKVASVAASLTTGILAGSVALIGSLATGAFSFAKDVGSGFIQLIKRIFFVTKATKAAGAANAAVQASSVAARRAIMLEAKAIEATELARTGMIRARNILTSRSESRLMALSGVSRKQQLADFALSQQKLKSAIVMEKAQASLNRKTLAGDTQAMIARKSLLDANRAILKQQGALAVSAATNTTNTIAQTQAISSAGVATQQSLVAAETRLARVNALTSTLLGRVLLVGAAFTLAAKGSEALAGAVMLVGVAMLFLNPMTGVFILIAGLLGQMKAAGLDFGVVMTQVGRVFSTIWEGISVLLGEIFKIGLGFFKMFGANVSDSMSVLEGLAFALGVIVGILQVLAVAVAIPFRLIGGLLRLAGRLTGLGGFTSGDAPISNRIAGGETKPQIAVPRRTGVLTPNFGEEDEPAMATGGVVRRPTRALVGESGSEAILPLNESTFDKLGGSIARAIVSMSPKGSSSAGEITIRVPIELDGHQIAEVVKRVNMRDNIAAFGA